MIEKKTKFEYKVITTSRLLGGIFLLNNLLTHFFHSIQILLASCRNISPSLFSSKGKAS